MTSPSRIGRCARLVGLTCFRQQGARSSQRGHQTVRVRRPDDGAVHRHQQRGRHGTSPGQSSVTRRQGTHGPKLVFPQACLSAASTHHLCKSIVAENTRLHPSVLHEDPLHPSNWANPNNSRWGQRGGSLPASPGGPSQSACQGAGRWMRRNPGPERPSHSGAGLRLAPREWAAAPGSGGPRGPGIGASADAIMPQTPLCAVRPQVLHHHRAVRGAAEL